ncbi:large ribosomal subunit protein mL63 [Arctopsyche grandis]|uniref:large ribosomal subunit protein mL63 n=1 Tax=Arctopsyche grandis TaxID=121162 RepID=UPI00406DA171
MRLGLCLFRRNPFPNGNIWRGRNRLVRRVLPEHLNRLKARFETEERNMLFLRHPYLTVEEEIGHVQACGEKVNMLQLIINNRRAKFKKSTLTEDILGSLNSSKAWD